MKGHTYGVLNILIPNPQLRRTREAEKISPDPAIIMNEAGDGRALPLSTIPDWPILVAKL